MPPTHRRADDRPALAGPLPGSSAPTSSEETDAMRNGLEVTGRPLAGLVLRCAGGDERAFGELFDLASRRVYGMVMAIVRDPAQSEEVAQDVFLEIWRTTSRFDPARGSVLGWVLAIAHRRAVDRVRASQAARNRDQRYLDGNQLITYDATSDEVISSLEAERVRAALEKIPREHRTALMLAYFEGCTHAEVAERLGIPLGTAKSRIRDGLVKLRELLSAPPAAS